VALLASAASSVVGFTIMGFAPMPMFSSYGILTALMIFLALSASLVVLPSLLLLVTPEKTTE
jgi:predicted RND superfamily exporter protein